MNGTVSALFSAGLGDVFRTIYQTAAYRFISEATSPVPVLVASHNPFAMEIFRYHDNASNFILYDLGHKYQEFLARGLRGADISKAICQFAGVDHESVAHGTSGNYVPEFHAPDDIDSSGHIVFQPFAGNASYRSLPPAVIESTLEVLRRLPCPVYLVTRSYIRLGGKDEMLHDMEDARGYAGGNVTVLEHLSVPACLNLVKSCRAYVGSWSSLQQAAWFEHTPVAVFYPEDCVDVLKRTGYAFGLDRGNTLGRPFADVDAEELESFLLRWSP